jgi:hypothetical protein
MNRVLVTCAVFVAGLAIGGAASWLMAEQQGDRGGAGVAGGQDLAPFDRPAHREDTLAGPAESRAGAAPIQPRSFKEASRGALEDGSVPRVGTGRISGKVKTEKGEAVAGVVVRADYRGERDEGARQRWKTGDGPPPDDDVESRVRDFIEDTERSLAMRREATSSQNGEFTIEGLLDEPYSLQAYLKGYSVTLDQRDLQWSARPGVWVDFTASPVIVLPVDVKLADGTSPKRAQVQIAVNNSSTGETWRPSRPELRLGAGTYAISVTAGDREEWRSEAQNVVLKEGAAPAPLVFKLAARTGIRGRVKVPKGYAVDSLAVFALRYSGSAVPDEAALRRGQNEWTSAWNGFLFNFHDLAPGTWLVGAGTWESVFATKTVEVAAGAIVETVLEITDSGATGLVVRVIGPDNAAVADVNLRVSPTSGQYDGSEPFSVRPKKDGAWVVASKKEGAVDPKDYVLQAHSERLGDKSVAMPAACSGELRIEMLEPASLEVTVPGYAGSGLEGRLKVDARQLTGGKEPQHRIYYSRDEAMGPDGRQTLKPLQPGRYRVELQYSRERWASSTLDKVDVDVGPGVNSVSIALPAVYTLVVVTSGEPSDANLNLQQVGTGSDDARWHGARIGPDGTATFEGLVAGTYRLSLWAPKARRQRSMRVTVPASGPVTFKEEAETALAVKALDADGYLASAGIQVGDVITGVDGAAFDGSRPAVQVLGGLMSARKELKLQILRGGKTLEATVDTEKFGTATNHTRALEPVAR